MIQNILEELGTKLLAHKCLKEALILFAKKQCMLDSNPQPHIHEAAGLTIGPLTEQKIINQFVST